MIICRVFFFFPFLFCYKTKGGISPNPEEVWILKWKMLTSTQIHFFKDWSSLDFLLIIIANISEQLLHTWSVLHTLSHLVFPAPWRDWWGVILPTFYRCGLRLEEIKDLAQGQQPSEWWTGTEIQLCLILRLVLLVLLRELIFRGILSHMGVLISINTIFWE